MLDRPRRCLAGLGLASALLAGALPFLELRTDGAAIYPKGDATVERTLADRKRFHETDACLVLLSSRPGGPSVATPQGFRLLRTLHAEIVQLEDVFANRVRSLANLIEPVPGETLLLAGHYLDDVPDGDEAFAELVRRVRSEPLTDGLYLAPDGRAAAIYVPAPYRGDRTRLVKRLASWIESRPGSGFDLRLTGPVAVEVLMGRAILADLRRLLPVLLLAITILVAFALRTPGGVLVTLAEVGVVLGWTFAAMSLTHTPVTLVTAILPVLLLTVAVADEVHLVGRFSAFLAQGRSRREALEQAISAVARPIVLTSVTTALGFLSFTSARVAPVRHCGAFAAFGVLLALALSFSLVPALILTLPERWFRTTGEASRLPRSERLAIGLGRRGPALACLALLPLAPGLARLHVADSWVDNFPASADVVTAERDFNAAFWGTYRYDVVLDHPQSTFFQSAPGLRVLEQLVEELQDAPHVGGLVSSLIAYQIHARVDGEALPVSELPPETILSFAGDLQKIQGRLDLDHYQDGMGRAARVRLHVRDADFERTRELEQFLDARLADLDRDGLTHHLSGELAASQVTVGSVVTNMLRSLSWTLVAVGVALAAVYRSIGRAAVVLSPLLLSLAVVFGIMGYAGWSLGIATSMFAAATIGIGVDFGLHFVHAYERNRAGQQGDRVARAFGECGRALRWNTIVLCGGLSVLTLSVMKPNRSLGILLAGAIAVSYIATLLLLPRLTPAAFASPDGDD